MGALLAHLRFAAITGSKFCIKSYSCVGKLATRCATAAVSILQVVSLCELSFIASYLFL